MSVWEKWRPWLQREKQLLLELALMLLVALVVGVYFLETSPPVFKRNNVCS